MTAAESELTRPIQPLTEDERLELAEAEAVIERGLRSFIEVGTKLAQVRDSRLYRETHPTFEAWLEDRCGLARNRAYQFMASASVATGMSKILDAPTPLVEAHAAVLVGLDPAVAAELYQVALAQGKVTADSLRDVRRRYERFPSSDAAHDTMVLLRLHDAGGMTTADLAGDLTRLGVDLTGTALADLGPDRGIDSTEAETETAAATASTLTDQLRDASTDMMAEIERYLAEGWPAAFLLNLFTTNLDAGQPAYNLPIEAVRQFWQPILDRLRDITVADALEPYRSVPTKADEG